MRKSLRKVPPIAMLALTTARRKELWIPRMKYSTRYKLKPRLKYSTRHKLKPRIKYSTKDKLK